MQESQREVKPLSKMFPLPKGKGIKGMGLIIIKD